MGSSLRTLGQDLDSDRMELRGLAVVETRRSSAGPADGGPDGLGFGGHEAGDDLRGRAIAAQVRVAENSVLAGIAAAARGRGESEHDPCDACAANGGGAHPTRLAAR